MECFDKRPVIEVAGEAKEFKEFFPEYVTNSNKLTCGVPKFLWFRFLEYLFKFFILIFLRPRIPSVGNLGKSEVEKVYNAEAGTYKAKHHLTTRGQDTFFRRTAGYIVLNYMTNNNKNVEVLDLCTGTGLTVTGIWDVLLRWRKRIKIVGLDYNARMLAAARSYFDLIPSLPSDIDISFVRGDATDMVADDVRAETEFVKFQSGSIDCATQVFGIGAIEHPLDTLREVLRLLHENGHYYMADMHKPIFELCGEWPFFGWLKMPKLELFLYENCTIPLVLKRLWAWRDTTAVFYLIRLMSVFDPEVNKYYGFKVIFFRAESKRWWLSFPFMPVAEILVEKVEISEQEATRRKSLLLQCKF